MVSLHTKLLFGASLWMLFASGTFPHGVEGHLSERNLNSIENPASSDVGLPDNFWEQFILYEGCFELNGTPQKERNDPQNNNYVCNDFCKNDGKNYSATIDERCLCFSNLPSGRVSADQCKTTCPNPVRFKSRSTEEDSSCDSIDCCGSLINNTMTVIQAIRIVPHRNLDEKGLHSDHHVTSSKDGFGNFIVHEGCFEITGVNPDESRSDPQNTNSVCIDYCVENGITYAATISERCLCLNSLPSNKLADDQCDAQCPGNIFEEGEACVGFGCCGAEISNAASIYQSVPASRDRNVNKSKKKKETK